MALLEDPASSMRGITGETSKHTVHAVSPDGVVEKKTPAGPLEVEEQVDKSGGLHEDVLEQRKTCLGRWKHPTRREGIQVLGVSIFTTLVIFSLLVVSAYQHNSPATLTLVIVLFVDTVVASMILSRLTCLHDADRQGLVYKSAIIDCVISALFIGLSLSVMVHAIHNLIERRYVSNTRLLIGTLLPTFIALLTLGVVKLMIAKASELRSMKSTSVISLVGAKMAMGVFVSTMFVHQDPTAWWVDSVFAIVISVSLLIYGSVSIYSIFKGGSSGAPWSATQGRVGDTNDGLKESEEMEI